MSLNCKVVCKRSRAHTTTGQSRVRDSLWCVRRELGRKLAASIIASRDSAYHCDKVSSVIDTRVRDASAQPYRERFIPHETMHGNAATAHFASRARLPGPSCEQRNIFSPRTFCQVARHFPSLPSLAAVCRALSAHRPYILALDAAPGFLRSAASGLTSLSAQGAWSRAASNAPPCASHPPYIPPAKHPSLAPPVARRVLSCVFRVVDPQMAEGATPDGGGSDPSLRRLTGRARGVRQDASRP